MPPKVSIVMPTRNRERFLTQAVRSCLRQTQKDLELIVVDDASSDQTNLMVRSLGDPRVIYIRQEVQQGSVACLNLGFRKARGQYLTWTADDDYYSSDEALKIMTDILDHDPGTGFVYAHYDMVDAKGQFLYEAKVKDPAALDRDNYVGHCFLYRREVYEAVGDYSPVYLFTEEYEYWLRVRERFVMRRIPDKLYCHRLHATSITMTHDSSEVQKMVALARKRFIPAWQQHFFLAESHYHAGCRIRAFGNAFWSLFLNPFNRAGWRMFFLAALPGSVVAYVRDRRIHPKKVN